MIKGNSGEIFLQTLNRPQDVMIPSLFTRTKWDTKKYIRLHFSTEDAKKLLIELRTNKKHLPVVYQKHRTRKPPMSKPALKILSESKRRSLLGELKDINRILRDFSEDTQFDTIFDSMEIYVILFNSPHVYGQTGKEYRIDLEFESNSEVIFEKTDLRYFSFDYITRRRMMKNYGNPTPIEAGGSLTYKQLLKSKHIQNKFKSPTTNLERLMLRRIKRNEYMFVSELSALLPNFSYSAINKSLRKLVAMKLLIEYSIKNYKVYKKWEN